MHDIPDPVFKSIFIFNLNPANSCPFKVSNETKCEICSHLTMKTSERHH